MPFLVIAAVGFLFLLKMGEESDPLPQSNGNGVPPSLPPQNDGSGSGSDGSSDGTVEAIAGAVGTALSVLVPALMTPVPAGTVAVAATVPPAASSTAGSVAATAALSASLTATLVVVIVVIVIIITVSIIVSVIEGNALYYERFTIHCDQNFQFRASQAELFGEIPDYTSSFTAGAFSEESWFKNLPTLYPTLQIKPINIGDPLDFAIQTHRDAGGLQGIVDKIVPWQRRILSIEIPADSGAVKSISVTKTNTSFGNSIGSKTR